MDGRGGVGAAREAKAGCHALEYKVGRCGAVNVQACDVHLHADGLLCARGLGFRGCGSPPMTATPGYFSPPLRGED